ncbi:MAG: hypothetical protein KF785_09395 [Gemmatimonadales bacterium]|nr:hypothetical protein [Gemmatimonadales bacterium]
MTIRQPRLGPPDRSELTRFRAVLASMPDGGRAFFNRVFADAKAAAPVVKKGRPSADIDREEFERLCKLHYTERGIAAWFDCSIDTLSRFVKRAYRGRTFLEVFLEVSAKGHPRGKPKQLPPDWPEKSLPPMPELTRE